MKKSILSFALLSIAAIGTPAFAQHHNSAACNNSCESNKVCNEAKVECNDTGDCESIKDCDAIGDCKRDCDRFKGIELTDAQKKEIKALDNAVQTSRNELKDAMKAAKNDEKSARIDVRSKMNEIHAKYLADLKKILTHDQYVTYLENSYLTNQTPNRQARIGQKAPGKKILERGAKEKKDRMDKRVEKK